MVALVIRYRNIELSNSHNIINLLLMALTTCAVGKHVRNKWFFRAEKKTIEIKVTRN